MSTSLRLTICWRSDHQLGLPPSWCIHSHVRFSGFKVTHLGLRVLGLRVQRFGVIQGLFCGHRAVYFNNGESNRTWGYAGISPQERKFKQKSMDHEMDNAADMLAI